MNVNVRIDQLDKPLLSAANAILRENLYSIYFSKDRKTGYIVLASMATFGDEVIITEGPTKVIGKGIVIDVT